MEFEYYYYSVWPLILLVCQMCGIWYANRKLRNKEQFANNRPDKCYVKARILVVQVFKTQFLEIKKLAEELKDPQHSETEEKYNKLRVEFNKLVDHSYDLLMSHQLDGHIIHKAIHFEIKKNCMEHPFDILGSSISKEIESSFQDAISRKQQQPQSQVSLCLMIIQRFFIYTKTKITLAAIPKKLQVLLLTLVLIFVHGIILYAMIKFKIWLECGLIFFLELLAILTVCYLKDRTGYAQYTLLSIVISVSKVVFMTIGLYLYDYSSDLQVFEEYRSPKSCNGNSTALNRIIPTYSIFRYVKHLVMPSNDKESSTVSEVLGPLLVCLLIVFVSSLTTLPSLRHIGNEIQLTLRVSGALKSSTATDAEQDGDKKIVNKRYIPLQKAISRSQLSIDEARTESVFQLMIQWAIYFTLSYWLSLASVAEEKFPSFRNNSSFTLTDISNEKNQDMLTADDICGIENSVRFWVLWKSAAISFVSLSLAQYKANNIQHELCLSFQQKILYFLACVCNTVSYTTLVILVAINLNEFAFLAADTYHRILYFCLAGFAIFVPLLMRGIIVLLKRILRICRFSWNNGDEIKTRQNGMLDLLSLKYFLLPTSQTPQNRFLDFWKDCVPYYKEVQVSYHTPSCPNLITSFVNQCFTYIVVFSLILILGIWNLNLLHGNESLKILASTIDISPCEISRARYIFLISCCFTVPMGWIFSYVFLYLYFKYDKGYFSIANIYFEYNDHREDDITSNLVTCDQPVGEWIDLSGLDQDVESNDGNEIDIDNFQNSLNLNEAENIIFEEIKRSFPFYRERLAVTDRRRQDVCIGIRFALFICTFTVSFVILCWYLKGKTY